MKNIPIISYVCGVGAENHGCSFGPLIMENSEHLNNLVGLYWQESLVVNQTGSKLEALPAIANISKRLAQLTYKHTDQHQPFIVIGGDHTCAIGTWSGVAAAMESQDPIGLIWIDAHLDSHTLESTPSDNIHGMPLATLLGHGDAKLTEILSAQPKLQPRHTCIIGARSFEEDEQRLLKHHDIRIFYIDEVHERGFDAVFAEAIDIVSNGTQGFGISFDVDAIDPNDAPGTGTREPNGITANEFLQGLQQLNSTNNLLGIDIAEFNPNLDQQHKTEKLVADTIATLLPILTKESS